MTKKTKSDEPSETGRYRRAILLAAAISRLPATFMQGENTLRVLVSSRKVGFYLRQKEVTCITADTTLQAVTNTIEWLRILKGAGRNNTL